MESSELKSKAVKGSIWALLEKFSIQLMQFVVGVILARLLDPKDFGLLALATIFSGIASAITDGGFEKTLIQRKEVSPIQTSTIFYINAGLGALLTLMLFISAPSISAYFNEPKLTSVLQVMSLGIFINSLAQVQRTLLMKQFNFKKISYSQMLSAFTGGVVGATLAFLGFGVWALVFSMLSAQTILLVIFWTKSTWYPDFQFSLSSIKGMLSFGMNILFSSIVFFFIDQFSNFLIGKYYSGRNLGLVNRGSKTPDIIVNVIQSVVLKIAFPFFATVQDDPPLFKKGLKKAVQIIAFFTFPLITVLFINAREITLVLFTEKWIESVPYLQLFCLVKLFQPFISLYREVIVAKGNAKLLTKAISLSSVIEVVLLIFAIKYGLQYVIVALLISVIFQFVFYLVALSKRISVDWIVQLQWLLPYFVLSILVCLTSYLAGYLLKSSTFPLINILFIKLFAGGCTYLAGAYFLNIEEVAYVRQGQQYLVRRRPAKA